MHLILYNDIITRNCLKNKQDTCITLLRHEGEGRQIYKRKRSPASSE